MAGKNLIIAAWRTNKIFPALILALLLINIAAYLVITQSVEPLTESLERDLIQKQTMVRQARQKGEIARSPWKNYQRIKADLQTFQKAIPEKEHFTALIGEIFYLSQKAKLAIDQITYDPKEVAERKMLNYSLVFSVAGTYDQIKKFIHSLEQSPRIIAIEEMILSGSQERTREVVNLRIRLSTYFRSDIS